MQEHRQRRIYRKRLGNHRQEISIPIFASVSEKGRLRADVSIVFED